MSNMSYSTGNNLIQAIITFAIIVCFFLLWNNGQSGYDKCKELHKDDSVMLAQCETLKN